VTTIAKPAQPIGLSKDDVDENSISVTWNQIADLTYKIHYMPTSSSSWITTNDLG
jgi:hypothetical protein